MKLLGFNYTKVSVEKLSEKSENLKISTNIDISEISEVKQSMLKSKETVISVKFSYDVKYNPDYANISLGGNFLLSLEPKTAKKVLKEWENKQMPEEFKVPLFNLILKKANIKALELEDELNLPLHMPMPKVGSQTNKQNQKQNQKKK